MWWTEENWLPTYYEIYALNWSNRLFTNLIRNNEQLFVLNLRCRCSEIIQSPPPSLSRNKHQTVRIHCSKETTPEGIHVDPRLQGGNSQNYTLPSLRGDDPWNYPDLPLNSPPAPLNWNQQILHSRETASESTKILCYMEFSSVQFSPLTDCVVGETWRTIQQRSSSTFPVRYHRQQLRHGQGRSLMLSIQHFLWRPQRRPSSKVSWMMALVRL